MVIDKNQRKDIRAASTAVVAGAAVAIVAVACIMGYIFLSGGGEDEGPSMGNMDEGSYLQYERVVTSGDSVLDYMEWYNVTDVNSTSYSITMTMYFNGYYYADYNYTVAKDEVMSIIANMPSGMNDMGQMTIDTALGSRDVIHYQGVYMGQNLDFYFGLDNGILYRYHYVLGGTTGEMNLIGTNLSWV